MIDAKAFGEELAGIVKAATTPLLARIDALEKAVAERRVEVQVTTPDPAEIKAVVDEALAGMEWREPEGLGERIKSAAAEAVAAIPAPKDGADGKDGIDGRDGVDGKDGASVTVDDVMPELRQRVDEYLAALPIPKDGKDGLDGADGKDGVNVIAEDVLPALMKHVDGYLAAIPAPRDGRDGIDGKDGISVTAEDVLPALMKRADDYLSAIPAPKDGRDGVDGKDGKDGERGEKGADGIGLAGALIDREGNLVVTLTNGETKALGPVVGRDGERGKDGEPGQDGIGFDDMTLDYDGERGFTFLFQKGERIEERRFVVPVILDRGVYRAENVYAKGDAVSYGGSVWIAQRETKARPDGSSDWRLSVKAGRDGKDGVLKAAPEAKPLKIGGGNAS